MKRIFILCLAIILGSLMLLPMIKGKNMSLNVELAAHKRLINVIERQSPQTFHSDGCSGGMSTIWREVSQQVPQLAEQIGNKPPWESCCVAHDQHYHNAGGASTVKDSFKQRLLADKTLRDCVSSSAPEPAQQENYQLVGKLMFSAVRLGGLPCTGLSWRWGYGFAQCE